MCSLNRRKRSGSLIFPRNRGKVSSETDKWHYVWLVVEVVINVFLQIIAFECGTLRSPRNVDLAGQLSKLRAQVVGSFRRQMIRSCQVVASMLTAFSEPLLRLAA